MHDVFQYTELVDKYTCIDYKASKLIGLLKYISTSQKLFILHTIHQTSFK